MRAVLVGALIVMATAAAWCQESRGRITGRVTDPQGAVIPAAEVVAANEQTGVQTKAQSNESGLYVLPFLQPGKYGLMVTVQGFKRYERKGIVVETAEEIPLEIAMQLGELTETITISETTPLLESTTATVGQFVDSKVVSDMPLAGRRAMELVRLAGNVVFISYGDAGMPQFSLAGGRVRNQMFWLDGGNNQNMRLGVGQIDTDPPVEVIQEFRVLQNSYGAEFGGSAGGLVISSTKSGTNTIHGSGFEFFRNDALNGADFFAPTQGTTKIKAPLRHNLFGGTIGGPIIRNRTHFFAGYEGTRRKTGSSQILTVPSVLQRQGDFSQTFDARGVVIPIYDSLNNRQPFAGNVIPSSRIDPVARQFVEYYPVPNRAPSNVAGANNFAGNRAQVYRRDNVTARVDHVLSDANRLYFRFFINYQPYSFTSTYPKIEADPAANSPGQWEQNFMLADTHTFTPRLIMDLRYTFGNRKWHDKNPGIGSNIVETVGLKGVPTGSFPALNAAGVAGLGNPSERRQFPIHHNQIVNSWTYVSGKHVFKAGGELRKSSNYEVNRGSISGTFGFATTGTGLPGNAQTGFGFATFLSGFVNSLSLRDTDPLDRYSWYLGWYVQDDWKVTPNLTLNLGLRWETDTPMTDTGDRMNSFSGDVINPVSGTPGIVRFAGVDGWPSSGYEADWNNFGPRFGFAWRPGGSDKWVVRGGFGVFYEHPFGGGVPNVASLGFEKAADLSSPDNGVTPAFYLRNGIQGLELKPSVRNSSFGAVAAGRTPTTNVTFFERNRPSGYAQQFSLGIQRQLPGDVVFEISYMGNLNRKMPLENLTLNQVPAGKLGPGNAQILRPFPQFNNVVSLVPPLGVNNYHSGTVRLEKRFTHGVSFLGTYTWARNLGNVNQTAGTDLGDNQIYQDQYNRRIDKGPLAIDVVHRLAWSSVCDLPFGKGRRWMHNGAVASIFGGWTVGSIISLQSGGPFTVVTQTNSTNAFSAGAQRANVLRDGNLPAGQRTVQRWFDTEAFAAPPAYTFGNAGRGVLRADGRSVFDFSIIKNFTFKESRYVQFRGELLNAFNHPDFMPPNHSLGSAAFGQVSANTPPRNVQFGLRIVF